MTCTIVAVHGTFASGPPEGEQWWQTGGTLEKKFRILLENNGRSAEDLEWRPFIWDGANSEASRRAAANRLADELIELDSSARPHLVIGHSHGGSVIASALVELTRRQQSLSNLTHWVTVGSPFLAFNRSPSIFQRLGTIGQIILISIFVFAYLYILFFIDAFDALDAFGAVSEDNPVESRLGVSLFIVAPVLVYFAASRMWDFVSNRRDASRLAKTQALFQSRFVPLWHPDDEAINGIGMASRSKVEFFTKGFFANIFSGVALFVVPVLLVLSLVLNYDRNDVNAWLGISDRSLLAGLFDPDNWLLYIVFVVVPEKLAELDWTALATVYLWSIPFFLIGISFAVFYGTKLLAAGVSPLLSSLLNRLTTSAIRTKAGGVDVGGLSLASVDNVPGWISDQHEPIPPEVAEQIKKRADKMAALLVSQFREQLGTLSIGGVPTGSNSSPLEFELAGELIHTTYFDSDSFCSHLFQRVIPKPSDAEQGTSVEG
ncbi:MAG: hypothetical protein GKR97_07195 [Rhizobiaceae bacterium]|nr:hypothetical protein [Rhizobiaceae bacterium]